MRPIACIALVLSACATTAPAPVAAPPKVKAAPTPPTLRLDDTVRPTKGSLDLTIDPSAERLSGLAGYELEVSAAVEVVWLNGTGLTVGQATIDGAPAEVLPGNEDFLGLRLAAPLSPGHHTVEVRFEAPIDHARSRGVYAEKEGELVYAYTFFEPIDARRAFPCFDQPSAKIPWALTLHAKSGQLARANTQVTATTPEADGWTRFDFAPSRPLPSYLVAFMVGPFEDVDAGLVGRARTPLHFILPQGRSSELGFAREVTPKVVAALEDYFDMDYPYGKLDVAVVPRFWGTMEHPGLVAMGQPLTLIRPEDASRERRLRYTNILAHELAHYWFGDLVTTRWWDDTWLNEALGSWLDPIITDAALPELRTLDERPWHAQGAMLADELASAHPIRRPVERRTDIEASFDNDVTYAKGAAVLHMFEAAVGPDKWRAFLRAYVRAHLDRTATAEDFFADAKAHLGEATAAGLANFITAPGLPRLDAAPVCEAARTGLLLRQRRSSAAEVNVPAATFLAPACVRAGDGGKQVRQCATLQGEETFLALPFCPRWVVLNDGASGYYRSAVNANTVRSFLDGSPVARQAALSEPEQVMLVKDLQVAVARGEVQLDEALRLMPLLLTSPNDRLVALGLSAFERRVDDLPEALESPYRASRERLCRALAGRLGWVRGADDSDDREQLRVVALACALEGRSATVIDAGAGAFSRWVADRAHASLPPDLLPLAMRAAMLKDEAKTFEQLLGLARGAADRQHRGRFLTALAQAQAPALAERARALLLGTEFDLRETWSIVPAQLGRRATRVAAWAWLEKNVDDLLGRMRGDEGSWLLSAAAGNSCEPGRRAAAEALLAPRAKKVDGAETYVQRALESADRCIAEQARTLPALTRYLDASKKP